MEFLKFRRKLSPGILALTLLVAAAPIAMAGSNAEAKEKYEEKEKPKAPLNGSIKVSGKHSDAELNKMAKITMEQAEKAALVAVEAPAGDKKVSAKELEAEGGCLIYSIVIKVKGKPGVQEILIDAGDGKVLGKEVEGDEEDEDDENPGR